MLCSPTAKAGRIGPALLLEFLQVGGHEAGRRFGKQFNKIMDVIKDCVLPRFQVLREKNPDGIAATITQLSLLVDEFYANGKTFSEPEGKQMKQKESELSQDV